MFQNVPDIRAHQIKTTLFTEWDMEANRFVEVSEIGLAKFSKENELQENELRKHNTIFV